MVRSTIQRCRYRRNARPSCVAGRTRFFLCGQISSMPRCRNQPLSQRIAVVGFVGDHAHRLLPWPSRTMAPGMQNKGGLPEEHPRRRPPPSTSSPCPAWFFRLLRPLFRRSKTAVQERLAPLQLLALVQLAQERTPDRQPNALLVPVPQSSPARGRMWILFRQVLPASAAAENPQNPFQHPTVLDPRTATLAVPGWFGEQGRDFLPLRFGQQRTGPRHRPSLGAADSAYLSFHKTQPSSFQRLVPGCATASSIYRKRSCSCILQ